MGNCDSKICDSSDVQVSANPDVAGIGVLVAFAISAVSALLAMIFGYCTNSFPENTMTEFDHYYFLIPMRRRFDYVSGFFGRSSKELKNHNPNDFGTAHKKRCNALERFLLTLSDQQLVTGLAVLIAGYMKMCSMPLYYFNIIASLAWFSSATHLATLGALREYLISHRVVRDWRVIAMIVVLALLFLAQPPAWTSRDSSNLSFCFFHDAEILITFSNMVTLITTLGFLLVIYTQRIARLYSLDLDWNISDSLIEVLAKLLSGANYRDPSRKRVEKDNVLSKKSNASISALIRKEREDIRYARFHSAMVNSNGRLKAYAIAIFFIAQELNYGFVSQVTLLIFVLAYGLAYTIIYRIETPRKGIEGNQNEMGFGQLVPLFLLLLPALAVGELYFEQHDKSSSQIDHDASHKANASTPPVNMIQPDSAPAESPEVTESFLVSNTSRQEHRGDTDGESLQSVQASNPSSAIDRSPSPATRLEELLRSLNSTEDPAPKSNITRKDTGWAIAKANNYQSEGSVSSNLKLHKSQAIAEEPDHVVSDGTTESTGKSTALASLTTNATLDSMQETQSASTPQESPKRTVPKAVYANIHYHRILTCVFLFQFTFQLLFALALGGVFGEEGYLLASGFLVVLMAVAVFVVVDGTRQRLMEIKEINEANLKPSN